MGRKHFTGRDAASELLGELFFIPIIKITEIVEDCSLSCVLAVSKSSGATAAQNICDNACWGNLADPVPAMYFTAAIVVLGLHLAFILLETMAASDAMTETNSPGITKHTPSGIATCPRRKKKE